jgi:phosphate/phosphite/phosphonate ABC transporter binding protein
MSDKVRVGVASTASGSGAEAADDLEARLQAFCKALSGVLGVEVEPHAAADYPSLLDAMNLGRVDVAWLPPVLALRAASAGRALPIALPMRGGVSSFHSALFARAGTPLRRPADLHGVRAAWVDRNSASGYLVIRASLRAQGVEPTEAFATESFLGSHERVVQAVLSGEADVGATFMHHTEGSGVWRAGWGEENVHVLARVGPIPADVVAAGIHMPVARIRQVQSALTEAGNPELAEAARALLEADSFVKAESAHLSPLEALLDFLEDNAYRFGSQFPPPN